MLLDYHKRKLLRISGFNYNSNGCYFVTFCTQSRLCLFGDIVKNKMLLNQAGLMVHKEIATLSERYLGISVDKFVVMPDHVHALIIINNDVGLIKSIPNIIRSIKTFTTNNYISSVYTKGWVPFEQRLWQRGYYESIIRDKGSLDKIREYIILNPSQWKRGQDNPDNLYM